VPRPGLVGIIANPAAGRDIRRLVAHGRVVPNQEKSNTLRRVLLGLDAVGVERALLMPDRYSLARQALDGLPLSLDAQLLEMWLKDAEDDSVRAATAMREAGAGCLVVLGGDGTNRAVAKACGDVPLLSISTGTNNVFPVMVEGTVAGLAAGLVARGIVPLEAVCVASKRLEVYLDGALHDLALVDVAVAAGRMVGAGAIWDIGAVSELFLTRAQVGAIGLSSIGALVQPVSPSEQCGLHVTLGPGGTRVLAPVAPGMVRPVAVQSWRRLALGERLSVATKPSTLALDGERLFTIHPEQRVEVELSNRGPRVVSVEAALREAAKAGVFRLPGET